MAATGDNMGVFKGVEGDAGLSSHQDLQQQVSGGDCGGTMIFCKGNDNMCDDVGGGSYVFVGDVNACDHVGDVDVENEGVVVGTGGNDGGLLAETGKGGAFHGELLVGSGSVGVVEGGEVDCEVKVADQVRLKDESGVEVEDEVVVVGVNDCEVKVEDQVGMKDESGVGVEDGEVVVGVGGNDCEVEVEVEDQVGLKDETVVRVENGEVDFGDGGNEQDYGVEEDNCGLLVVTEKDVALQGEFLVETGTIGVEGQLKLTELKLVEECLEPEISVTCSVDCVAHELGEDQAKLKQINDLANDADLGESKETELKSAEASELSEIHPQISNEDVENSWKADSTINSVGSESNADINLEFGIQHRSDMPVKDATVAGFRVSSGSAALLECSSDDSVNVQTLGFVAKAKPFQFLIKIPKFDDEKLLEQIKDAQLLIKEKTTRTDDIRIEIEMKQAKLRSINNKFEATKSDERAARRLVKLKRQEIDFIQDGITKVKNLISVTDINYRIKHMEYMIEHETNPLEEEKQLLREINTLGKLRDQISSNVYLENEDNPAFSQLEPMERQLKALRKELGDLKAKVSNAVAAAILLGHEYNGESKKLKELQAQFRAANDVRQDIYKYFLGLKRKLHEKSKYYCMYKDEAKAANDCAVNGDREALYRLCTNQVETFMDLWNKNDEFREDYVRCNMRSTLRRLKTSDGRSLGSYEEAPIIPIYVGEREDMQLSTPSITTHPSPANMKQENIVKPVKSKQVDGESWVVAEPKKKMLKDKTSVKPIPEIENVFDIVSGHLESLEIPDEKKQTEKELESTRKAEMLRREEMEVELKEKLRQEERAKAQEALDRKRRNAEKVQMRATVRAQKEAEHREREREKRLRKKEKKNVDGENGLELETNSTMEESTDSPDIKLKKSSQCNKYNKPKADVIPPSLRNRGRRQMFKDIMCWILTALVVLFVFMVTNGSSNHTMKPRTKGDRFSGNHW